LAPLLGIYFYGSAAAKGAGINPYGWFMALLSSHHFPIFDIFFLAPFGQIQMVVVFFFVFCELV
jgi:hypothetical protein